MAKKIHTHSVPKLQYGDYWKKALDFFQGMSRLYLEQNWNSTALEGIHAAISAADAVLIFARGVKSSSQKHADVTSLIAHLSLEGAKPASQHLAKIISVKSLVEYSGDSYLPNEAAEIVKQVERFFNWVRSVLPK